MKQYNDLKILYWDDFINNYGNKDIDKYNNILKERHGLFDQFLYH